MSSTVLKIIKPHHALDKDIRKNEIMQTILNETRKIAHLSTPTNADFIQFVGSLIENLVLKKR